MIKLLIPQPEPLARCCGSIHQAWRYDAGRYGSTSALRTHLQRLTFQPEFRFYGALFSQEPYQVHFTGRTRATVHYYMDNIDRRVTVPAHYDQTSHALGYHQPFDMPMWASRFRLYVRDVQPLLVSEMTTTDLQEEQVPTVEHEILRLKYVGAQLDPLFNSLDDVWVWRVRIRAVEIL
jgi:hypothetical protein